MQFVCLDAERRAFAAELPDRPIQERSGAVLRPSLRTFRLHTAGRGAMYVAACFARRVRACESARTEGSTIGGSDRRVGVGERPAGVPCGSGRSASPLVEMWREVPHDLLPVATATSGSLSVPRSPGAWRVQAIGQERASSWVDVPTEAYSAELTLLASEVRLPYRITADGAPLRGRQVLPGADRRRFGAESADRAARLRVGGRRGPRSISLCAAGERATVVVSSVTRRGAAFLRTGRLDPAGDRVGPRVHRPWSTRERSRRARAGAADRFLTALPDGFGVSQRHQGRSGPDGLSSP